MRSVFILFFVIVLGHINLAAQQGDSLSHDTRSTVRQRILVINSFDAISIKARNNKKDLFRELTDSLVLYLYKKIDDMPGFEPVVIPGILNKTDNLDSIVLDLVKRRDATRAIVIWSLDVRFEEAGEKEETDAEDGKPRIITTYNLCDTNEYILYNDRKTLKHSAIQNCEFFTTRSVKGRFGIKFGPDIVGKRKHTFEKIKNNASAYLTEIHQFLISN